MITARQKKSEKISLSLLFKLTKRSILFLFLLLTVLSVFYVIGNYQLFLASNQKIILNAAAFTATALLVLSATGTVTSILCIIRKKRKRLYYAINLALIILSAVYAVFFLFLFRATVILSSGI